MRALAQMLAASPSARQLARIDAVKRRGPWKRTLPHILETLEAVGRARQTPDGWRG